MLSSAEVRLARRDPGRAQAPGPLFRRVAATALMAAIAACSGGGGGDAATPPPPPPPAPAPAPVPAGPIAAQMSVPTPIGYDADRLAAFNRLNEIRLSAGLGMLAQNVLMDQAAQAHVEWMIANDAFTHQEQAGTPGFSGVDWWNRDESLGYVPLGGSEIMSSGVGPAAGIDTLVNGVYHRIGLLAFEPVDVGIGWSALTASNVSKPLVLDITRPGTDTTRGLGQAAQPSISGAAIWPLDGARGVSTHLGFEVPNPVPSQDVLTLGTPASITVDRSETVEVSSFEIANATTGAVVPTVTLTSANDPNGAIPASFVAAVPLAPLSVNVAYRVVFSGRAIAFPSGNVLLINRTWSFTTAAQ